MNELQAPLLTIVLEDPELAGRAAGLVADAGAQVADDSAILDLETAGEARDFVNTLAGRGPAELRNDLRIVGERLARVAGLSTEEIVHSLMERGPGDVLGAGQPTV